MMTLNSDSRQGRSARAGAAAVEMALVSPLFLLLLGGIIEFGQAFRVEHALSNAARRGARAAIVDNATSSQVIQKVKTNCKNSLGAMEADIIVTIARNGISGANLSTAATGDEICVTVGLPYSKVGIGFFSNLFANQVLSSSCTLECE